MGERGIQVINRAFDILELLSLEKDGLGVTEISKRIGLHKSTVHRILSSMAERGYIEKSQKGNYRVGLKLIEISSVYLNNVELKTEARPFLWELTSKLNQPTHLAIMDSTDAVYIDKVEVVNNMRLYSQIGRRIPLYCSALGKCLLSGLSDAELDEKLSKLEFHRYTSHTITGKEELIRQVKLVRRNGWAFDDEEHDKDIRCIAAPVFDYRNKVVASVSVAGPAAVFSTERTGELAGMVLDTSRKISGRMGYRS